jgi:hypothetical protein
VHKSAIQAPWRRLDLSDCSKIVLQQSVAQDEAFSASGLNSFFQPAQNVNGAFGAPPGDARNSAGPMMPPTACGLTPCRKLCPTSTKARAVGPNVCEWMRCCVEGGHRERGRILCPFANALVGGIFRAGPSQVIRYDHSRHEPALVLRARATAFDRYFTGERAKHLSMP